MAENFFHNDYVVEVKNSNIQEFIGKKIHAQKFLNKTESLELNIKYIGDNNIILINDFNDFIEGQMI